MATMTADGLEVRKHDSLHETTVKPGDRIRLFNGMTGTVHCWAAGGKVVVMIDDDWQLTTSCLRIAAVEAGDGDIVTKL